MSPILSEEKPSHRSLDSFTVDGEISGLSVGSHTPRILKSPRLSVVAEQCYVYCVGNFILNSFPKNSIGALSSPSTTASMEGLSSGVLTLILKAQEID